MSWPPALTRDEIQKMRKVCQLAARILEYIEPFVKPGVTLNELNDLIEDYTRTHGAVSAPLGYYGYPKSICTSVNDVVCHGVPDDYQLKEGDIVNIDVTPMMDGFYGDASKTFCVGRVSDEAARLVQVAQQARDEGIKAIRPGEQSEILVMPFKCSWKRAGILSSGKLEGMELGGDSMRNLLSLIMAKKVEAPFCSHGVVSPLSLW